MPMRRGAAERLWPPGTRSAPKQVATSKSRGTTRIAATSALRAVRTAHSVRRSRCRARRPAPQRAVVSKPRGILGTAVMPAHREEAVEDGSRGHGAHCERRICALAPARPDGAWGSKGATSQQGASAEEEGSGSGSEATVPEELKGDVAPLKSKRVLRPLCDV
eukprot:Skav223786  [mRNA]  locus=scaffold575:313456:326133:+ [translate_table: standard]